MLTCYDATFAKLLSKTNIDLLLVGDSAAMVMNGQIVIRPMMYIALSYDHRIIDGAAAVRFLVHIKDLLEDPDSLLLEF